MTLLKHTTAREPAKYNKAPAAIQNRDCLKNASSFAVSNPIKVNADKAMMTKLDVGLVIVLNSCILCRRNVLTTPLITNNGMLILSVNFKIPFCCHDAKSPTKKEYSKRIKKCVSQRLLMWLRARKAMRTSARRFTMR
jgi:hypothetical protein